MGDGVAVKSACAAAQLVQNNKRVGRGLGKDGCRLFELDHECRAACHDIVVGADPSKNTVNGAQCHGGGWNVAAKLRHNDGDAGLQKVRLQSNKRSSPK